MSHMVKMENGQSQTIAEMLNCIERWVITTKMLFLFYHVLPAYN